MLKMRSSDECLEVIEEEDLAVVHDIPSVV